MQSTGHTSTQAVSFVSIHGSVMMNGIAVRLRLRGQDPITEAFDTFHYTFHNIFHFMGLGASTYPSVW